MGLRAMLASKSLGRGIGRRREPDADEQRPEERERDSLAKRRRN